MPQNPSPEESPAIRLASAKLATSLFTASFGSRPVVVTSAPGSINLFGGHTGYSGAPVLSIAVERRVAVAAGLAPRWRSTSTVDGELEEGYLGCVVQELGRLGAAPPAANVAVGSAIPADSELAARAALAVALAKALSLLAGRRLTPAELVQVAVRVVDGVHASEAGWIDPTIATYGRRGLALQLECATGRIRALTFPGRVWVIEAGVSWEHREGWPSTRRRECDQALLHGREWRPGLTHLAQLSPTELEELQWRLPSSLVPRVRHVVTETARTWAAAVALARGNLQRVGRLLAEAHESLRLDYEATCAPADFLVSSAVDHGAYGARATGPIPGGTVILLLPVGSEARILAQVSQDFQDRFGRVPRIWQSGAAAGVRREAVR
jgi:galactokinase